MFKNKKKITNFDGTRFTVNGNEFRKSTRALTQTVYVAANLEHTIIYNIRHFKRITKKLPDRKKD